MRYFFAALITTVLLTFSAMAFAAASYPIYVDTQEQWMVGAAKTPTYSSIENAEKGSAGEVSVYDDTAYRVLETQGKWLLLDCGDEGRLWAEAKAFMELGAFLQSKQQNTGEKCSEDSPTSFRVDLDAAHKSAWILVQEHPVLMGTAGIIEVWDSEKTTLLWHSEALDGANLYNNSLICTQDVGDQWIQLTGDVNNDGKAEIIIKGAQSEIGPGWFSILQWNGEAFIPLPKGGAFLLLGKGKLEKIPARENLPESEDTEATFGDLFDGRYRTWVNDFTKINTDGTVTMGLQIQGKNESGDGLAQMRVDENWDLVFVKWESGPTMNVEEE